jgi:hypothetical protein
LLTCLTPEQQRALDIAYEREKVERDERRGLETRAAATVAALLVVVTGGASAISHVETGRISTLAAVFLGGAAFFVFVLLTLLSVTLAGGFLRRPKRVMCAGGARVTDSETLGGASECTDRFAVAVAVAGAF